MRHRRLHFVAMADLDDVRQLRLRLPLDAPDLRRANRPPHEEAATLSGRAVLV